VDAASGKKNVASSYYDANYRNFQSELYSEIRREAFGEDIGQNSWLTADEYDMFLSWLELSAGKVVLDVACGSGGPALRMAGETGCRVVGIDIHEDAIAAAKSLAEQRQLTERAQFQVVNAKQSLAFEDQHFDAITCIDAINHLPDRPGVIAEWTRMLKPGGRILFTDPVTLTGLVSGEELAVRSSAGLFLFTPKDYNKEVLMQCSLRLLTCKDVTTNVADVAAKRRAAREVRSDALRTIEGQQAYETQQNFLAMASRLAAERRLSRYLYVAERA
jgi:ubiquinone/menaquinone biosynthesis C-methylase UbiE